MSDSATPMTTYGQFSTQEGLDGEVDCKLEMLLETLVKGHNVPRETAIESIRRVASQTTEPTVADCGCDLTGLYPPAIHMLDNHMASGWFPWWRPR